MDQFADSAHEATSADKLIEGRSGWRGKLKPVWSLVTLRRSSDDLIVIRGTDSAELIGLRLIKPASSTGAMMPAVKVNAAMKIKTPRAAASIKIHVFGISNGIAQTWPAGIRRLA